MDVAANAAGQIGDGMQSREVTVKSGTGDFSIAFRREPSDSTGDYIRVFAMEHDTDREAGTGTIRETNGQPHIVLGFIETEDARALADLINETDTPAEPEYMQDAPTITDEDEDAYAERMPDWVEQSDVVKAYDRGYQDAHTDAGTEPQIGISEAEARIAQAFKDADMLGFERGYDAAVQDMRAGLMHDEVTPVSRDRD
jgi:hypothetical protein